MYLTIDVKRVFRWMAMFLAVLIPGGMYISMRMEMPEALETGSWGLSFQTPGQAPVGNATVDQLADYDAKFLGNTQENMIYLTFDCGYESGQTEQILDVLKAHNVPAAFFVVGNYITDSPELVRRMAEEGHIVGNHTWSHPNMSEITDKTAFAQQLQKVRDAYQECTGEEMPMYYRPPQGVYSEANLALAQELGYKTVFWSLAYVDWIADQQPSEEEALNKLTSRIHPGAVVLLHNTSATNAKILDRLLTQWEEQGYQFGSLDDLFQN